MKVSVCFGATRILVPCGNGDLLVKDLITDAIRRFKKASGKDPDAWIPVHHFQTQSGILDPDDRVRDVVDDREYIKACFVDSTDLNYRLPQSGGDGASGSSSLGHGSPDIFNSISVDVSNVPSSTLNPVNIPHIEVTNISSCPISGCGLQVRRSSDPNILVTCRAEDAINNKRWSAAAPQCGNGTPERILQTGENCNNVCLSPQWEEDSDDRGIADTESVHLEQHDNDEHKQQPFIRSGRFSMQFLGDGNGFQWMEAAEKVRNQHQRTKPQPVVNNEIHSKGTTIFKRNPDSPYRPNRSLPHEHKRKEPLGQAYESIREKDVKMLLIVKDQNNPLGLTAITDKEHPGALLVQHVEPNSPADYGKVEKGDRILEINSTKLMGLSELDVQKCLKRALDGSEIRVKVIRQNAKLRRTENDYQMSKMINVQEKKTTAEESKVATVSPTYKHHTPLPSGTSLQIANTRKLGRKIKINLKKGPNGLGFSVTTRDNPAGGYCPIYIKNILSRGAAIEDGHLRPGDRLLEINGISVTGKTQSDVVSILRGTDAGSIVTLLVSRPHELINYDQERDVDTKADNLDSTAASSNSLAASKLQGPYTNQYPNNQLGLEQTSSNGSQHFIDAGSESTASTDSLQAGLMWPSRERLIFHIPVHDTEKAGLGVSVKGKTSSNVSTSSNVNLKYDGDLGIFVKNVIHGGAASRDGRLRMNDQLICVNGVSLLGKSNSEAMQTLKHAIVNNPGEHPGMITLEVLRKATRSVSSGEVMDSNKENNFNVSENNGKTVIYLGTEQKHQETKEDYNSTMNELNRWSNPILDRLTGGTCSLNSTQKNNSYLGGTVATETLRTNNYCPRNESYCLATASFKEWDSPAFQQISSGGIQPGQTALSPKALLHKNSNRNNHHSITQTKNNNNVLIEDELIENKPKSLTFPNRPNLNNCNGVSTLDNSNIIGQNFDSTYSSQLSIETNNSNAGMEHFSRDALGRRSISEKHHAALDARETGTYQRNKKLREDRERERRLKLTKSLVFGGSVESLASKINEANINLPDYDKRDNKMISIGPNGHYLAQPQQPLAQHFKSKKIQCGTKTDGVAAGGELGPYLGLKKSSSLESLQTMVQELQMSNERDVALTLRSPRGKKRNDYKHIQSMINQQQQQQNEHGENRGIDIRARKHWLLEEFDCNNGGFEVQRNCLLQSSMNEGKLKLRTKKSTGILRGIGSMFRFGKPRKDVVMPLEIQQQQPSKTVAMSAYVGYNNIQSSRPGESATKNLATQPSSSVYNQPTTLATDNVILKENPTSGNIGSVVTEPVTSKILGQNIDEPTVLRTENGGSEMTINGGGGNSVIHQNDLFNHRYPHYRNYEQLCNPHKSSSKSQRQRHTYRSQRNQRTNQNPQQQQDQEQVSQYITVNRGEQPYSIDGNLIDYNPYHPHPSYNANEQQYDGTCNFTYRHGSSKYSTSGNPIQNMEKDNNSNCLTTSLSNYQRQRVYSRGKELSSRIKSFADNDSVPSQRSHFTSDIMTNMRQSDCAPDLSSNNKKHLYQHHTLTASSAVTTPAKV